MVLFNQLKYASHCGYEAIWGDVLSRSRQRIFRAPLSEFSGSDPELHAVRRVTISHKNDMVFNKVNI